MLVSKQNGSRSKVETKRLDFTNSLQVNNCVYSAKNATLHVSAASAVLILCPESCVSSAPSCIPSPFFFFYRRARVREEDGPIPLSLMPQNSTNRRLAPRAAPLTSMEVYRHLLVKKRNDFCSFLSLSSCNGKFTNWKALDLQLFNLMNWNLKIFLV